MGAQLAMTTFNGEFSKTQLKSYFRDDTDNCRYEYGHGGYSGTFAEKGDVKITDKVFKTYEEAEEYFLEAPEVQDKWVNHAYAVRLEPDAEPHHWLVGGWCSS